eukprot:457318-Pyramimonas_sp.AAC.1
MFHRKEGNSHCTEGTSYWTRVERDVCGCGRRRWRGGPGVCSAACAHTHGAGCCSLRITSVCTSVAELYC